MPNDTKVLEQLEALKMRSDDAEVIRPLIAIVRDLVVDVFRLQARVAQLEGRHEE